MFTTLKEIKELNVKAFQDNLRYIGKPYKLGGILGPINI